MNNKIEIGSVKVSGQENNSKQPFAYSQQKRTSHKDLSPQSGVNISTQFFNNPYNSTKNRSNGRSNNISPLNRYVSPKVAGPQESKIGQKRAQSSCRPSINNPNNYDGSLFSVLDQFKMSPQMPLNLGKSQEFSQLQPQQTQQPQNNQSQKRKIRILRQSIGSRQATRNDEPIIDEYEYLNNVSNINTNYNFMDQTPVSRKSQTRKENGNGNQNNPRQLNNSQMHHHPPPQISPNNIGDAYFKNSMFQSNTPISIKTPSSYVNPINNTTTTPTNPVIIRNSINNISVQIGNCNDLAHSFKLSNKHSKDQQMDNQLYDFNLENIDSPGLTTEQVYRIDTNISDERVNTQTTNKDAMNRTSQISTNNSKHFDYNSTQDDRQSRIYALQNYLKNTQTTKYSRNSRRSAAHSSHAVQNQVKAVVENNLIHSESKQSKNSTTVSNFNTNNITKISDENSNPEYQQTIKKQLNCIQVNAPQPGNILGVTTAPRNKSPLPQKIFQKFDQNIQLLGQTDPCNIKSNKNDKNLLNSYMDPTIISNQGNSGYSQSNQAKMQQSTVTPHMSSTMPQVPQEVNNQDVEELHFQFVEFQQKCKEWLKKIEL